MKLTTPARAPPGSWSAGIRRSHIAPKVCASASVRTRQGLMSPEQETIGPAAAAVAAIQINLRRVIFAFRLIRRTYLANGGPKDVVFSNDRPFSTMKSQSFEALKGRNVTSDRPALDFPDFHNFSTFFNSSTCRRLTAPRDCQDRSRAALPVHKSKSCIVAPSVCILWPRGVS